MDAIKESLTFDDVLLLPRYSNVLPSQTDISLDLTNKISLKVPFLSSAMDTVTEAKMAIAIADSGGIGIIHRNLSSQNQSKEVSKVKKAYRDKAQGREVKEYKYDYGTPESVKLMKKQNTITQKKNN